MSLISWHGTPVPAKCDSNTDTLAASLDKGAWQKATATLSGTSREETQHSWERVGTGTKGDGLSA